MDLVLLFDCKNKNKEVSDKYAKEHFHHLKGHECF